VNKAELVSALSSATDMSRAEATRAIDALFGVDGGIIANALRNGDKVQITGFGSFETKKREARKGRNPRTGKEINIAASTSAAFRIGKRLKDALGGS
jgi:DNA-binding protein HU-beta